MLTYNTHLKPLALPEYGRNIQRMVDYCLTIEDRDERTRCAYNIIKTMSILFPGSKSDDGTNRTFWDHLAIMSDFKLDIDWPYEVITAEHISSTPDPVAYDMMGVRYRMYGANIETMIKTAAQMPESDERTALITLIANQMKKCLLAINKDDDPDERIFHDLLEMSDGSIRVDSSTVPLHDYNVIVPVTGKKKKKK